MTYGSDVRLTTTRLDRMRPTQITVGYREVQIKRDHWKALSRKERKDAIATHWFPAVLGPGDEYYIVDHHHLGLALIEEGVSDARVMVLKNLSWLDTTIFWRMMEHNQWVHPYGVGGERCAYSRLPQTLPRMKDDPYRSLAGEMRIAGGFAKDTLDAAAQSKAGWHDFTDYVARLKALQAFRDRPTFAQAAETFKRVSNILDASVQGDLDPASLKIPAETQLLKGVLHAEGEVRKNLVAQRYGDVLESVGTLRGDVAALFDATLVNDPDPHLRRQRHLLLRKVRDLVGEIADFSAIQG